jgi:hypothetical protein
MKMTVRSDGVAGSSTEDAVAARADEASDDDQNDPEEDLTLEELDDANDDQDGCDDPEQCGAHVVIPFVVVVHY